LTNIKYELQSGNGFIFDCLLPIVKFTHRKDGRWVTTLTIDGKRTYLYGKTKQELQEKLRKMKRRTQTVEQFLASWLDTIASGCKPKTYESYEYITRYHLIPNIGKVRMDRLSPHDVQQLIALLQDRNLSPRTIHYAASVLSRALNWAVKWGDADQNVVQMVRLPRYDSRMVEPLTFEQAKQLLDTIQGHRLEALYRLAVSLGLRRGEIIALTWDDVDLHKRTLTIKQSKTQAGRRTLPLPPVLLDALKQHHARQAQEREHPDWQEHNLVFPSERGTPLSPRNLVRHFKALLQRSGLPDIRFHDLRHTTATFLIAQGVNIHVVKQVLGHSRISVTSDFYGHLIPGVQEDALLGVEQMLGDK
jgi:integrase